MWSRCWILIVLAACGRVGFDPLGEGGDAGGSGGAVPGDVCATALELQLGVTLVDQVLVGAHDDYPAASCGNGPEVVYRLTSPTSAGHLAQVIAPFDIGIMASPTCPPPGPSCSMIGGGQGTGTQVSVQLVAGVNYVLIDRGAGTGTTFSIRIE